jgi:hypothetical protein
MTDNSTQKTLGQIEGILDPKKQMKTVLFIDTVPAFVDLDLKTRGPFKKGDVLRIHIDIANLLILKGKAKAFDLD